MRSQDWATRSLRDKSKKLREAGSDEGVSREELARRSGLTEQEVHDTIAGMARAPVSLDHNLQSSQNDWSSPSSDSMASQLTDGEDVEGVVGANSLMSIFADAVAELPGDERLVIVLHYYSGLELKKIARMLDITESRASQLHTKSVLSLLATLQAAAS